MKINSDLKLVIPVRSDENGNVIVYGYHTPISREVYELNYRILSATKSAIFSKGLAFAAGEGPMIASLRLLDEGKIDAASRGDFDIDGKPLDGGAKSLLAEIKRLTVLLVQGANGFEMLPVDAAINSGKIDADDWREAESSIVFFTVGYVTAKRAEKQKRATALAGVMDALITSSDITTFVDSLRKSMQVETSDPKTTSSVPC